MKAIARSSMMGMTLGLEPRSLALCGPAATDRMDTPRGASRKHAVQLHHVMCCYLGTAFNAGLPFFVRLFSFAALRSSIASSSLSA